MRAGGGPPTLLVVGARGQVGYEVVRDLGREADGLLEVLDADLRLANSVETSSSQVVGGRVGTQPRPKPSPKAAPIMPAVHRPAHQGQPGLT